MKICIARLRSGDNFVEPLNQIMDSFYYLLREYKAKHPEHEFTYYNFGFNQKPVRNVESIEAADVILIPSEAEFTYHTPGSIHTLDLAKSNAKLEEVKPYFNNKRVILLRSDRRDDIDLYQQYVFPTHNIEYRVIDEIDFGNIHGMKYHFIKNMASLDADTEKVHDFVYWGSDKRKSPGGAPSGDIRHKIFKQIYKDEDINSYFIGRFYGFRRDRQWSKMKDIVPIIQKSYSTLCFNWMDSKATTSRYVEALACGCIPFVWQNYDEDDTFVADDFQRVWMFEDFKDKLSYIVNDNKYDTVFNTIEEKFKKVLKSPEEYYTMFESLLGKNL
jgi:hypothetical protein